VLPARSRQVPDSEAVPLSGPAYVALVQASTPAVWSVPENATATERLYQPFESLARSGWPLLTTGFVASYLRPNASAGLTFPALSVHVPGSEAVPLSGPE
jgi:hypothetical protein